MTTMIKKEAQIETEIKQFSAQETVMFYETRSEHMKARRRYVTLLKLEISKAIKGA